MRKVVGRCRWIMGKYWSVNSRAPWHDYTAPWIYHITLKKHPDVEPFGSLAGDWRKPVGEIGSSYISASRIGKAIKHCLRNISAIHPALRVNQYALMPDHLHMLISVTYKLDDILGRKLAAFKTMVNHHAESPSVFAKGFNDQILTKSRNLNVIYDYIRRNPYRLAVRFAKPEYFSRVNRIEIAGNTYATYGNFQLLTNPFKDQVVIHRKDAADVSIMRNLHDRWIHTAANNGVLVSPFISKAEKRIRSEAEDLGSRIILITHEAFTERFKPGAHDFELCA